MTATTLTAARLAAMHREGFVLLPGVLDAAASPRCARPSTADAHRPGLSGAGGRSLHLRVQPRAVLAALSRPAGRHRAGRSGTRRGLPHHRPDRLAQPPGFHRRRTAHRLSADGAATAAAGRSGVRAADADLYRAFVPGRHRRRPLPDAGDRRSHHAGRKPCPGETTWQGRAAEPVLCRAGDVLFFRSDLWHAGSRNRTPDRSRYLLQIHYGRRMVAQKFSPYLQFTFDPAVLAAATPRQRRLLGEHEPAEYD